MELKSRIKDHDWFLVMEYMARKNGATCSQLQAALHFTKSQAVKTLVSIRDQNWCEVTPRGIWNLTKSGHIEIGWTLSERIDGDDTEPDPPTGHREPS